MCFVKLPSIFSYIVYLTLTMMINVENNICILLQSTPGCALICSIMKMIHCHFNLFGIYNILIAISTFLLTHGVASEGKMTWKEKAEVIAVQVRVGWFEIKTTYRQKVRSGVAGWCSKFPVPCCLWVSV